MQGMRLSHPLGTQSNPEGRKDLQQTCPHNARRDSWAKHGELAKTSASSSMAAFCNALFKTCSLTSMPLPTKACNKFFDADT